MGCRGDEDCVLGFQVPTPGPQQMCHWMALGDKRIVFSWKASHSFIERTAKLCFVVSDADALFSRRGEG